MTVTLLIEHHLAFLSLKGGCIGSSESTAEKMPHCYGRPWPAVYINFVLKIHQIQVLTEPLCRA